MGFRELSRDFRGAERIIDALAKEHAVTRGYVNGIISLFQRGLFGRLKWLIFGR